MLRIALKPSFSVPSKHEGGLVRDSQYPDESMHSIDVNQMDE